MTTRSGFTLVEMLVVVIVIGILAAIAIPKFGNLSEEARTESCRHNMRNIATALSMYYGAVGNYPYAGQGHVWRTLEALNEYIENLEYLECPSCGAGYRYRITGRDYDTFKLRGWNRNCRDNHGMYVNGMPNW